MLKLEEIAIGQNLVGIDGNTPVAIVAVQAQGTDAVSVFFKTADGRTGERLLLRSEEPGLALAQQGRPWSFDANAPGFQLVTEAYRIQLAYLFDPMMAVHASDVEPLPHQIAAVYEAMLPRQPLRYILADDPGAGKTIMAGLLIRELIMRADAQRILIVAPGSLTGQWQDELSEKFGLNFELFTRERQESSPTGNFFAEQDQIIARLDQLARSDDFQAKLETTHWDLIVVDEAHKLSANYYGREIKKTRRFVLGEMLGRISRHFLLMTATPHNGKEADFQLFLSLIDGDRFFGKHQEGARKVDVSDLMRRMVKEELLKFDGTRLFPERHAYTANYQLSPAEEALYARVTTYVTDEMDRADKLEGQRKGTVGFALTQLQRRLASSPEAIFQSLRNRRRKLESRLDEMRIMARGQSINETVATYRFTLIDVPENLEEAEEELSPEDFEEFVEQVVDQATAAQTIPELEAEIETLRALEAQAEQIVRSGNDRKWDQLSRILHDEPEMRDDEGNRRKLIVFTEHRATLNYLHRRIGDFLGLQGAVVVIHGGTNRDERRKIQEEFRQNKQVLVLVATDAAGEGVNLQNANLMVNYDLPWNPNRIEQRFGRIHRIGQREVCHLWNIVAKETREGAVFQRLLEKLEVEREALGDRVFDVLGEAFDERSLKDLLLEAIRYGQRPEVKARLDEVIDNTLDAERLKAIFKRNALVESPMSLESLYAIKDEMDKAEARKLQPHFLRTFFSEAFKRSGGELRLREQDRFEIPNVPATLRERDRQIGQGRTPVLRHYHRICFDKNDIHVRGRPRADLMHPGHPLMAAVLDHTLERHRGLLKQGAILVNTDDPGVEPRLLLLVDHSVRDGSGRRARTVSRRLQFLWMNRQGEASFAGWAPHLDLQPLDQSELATVMSLTQEDWLAEGIEVRAVAYAADHIARPHFEEVCDRRVAQADKIHEAVKIRLTHEINRLSHQAIELDLQVQAGKQPRMQPENVRRRAEDLASRLEARERELDRMRQIVSATPVVVGGALVVPAGLLASLRGEDVAAWSADAKARSRIERIAMDAVMRAEVALGHAPRDVSAEKCGWDITSHPPMVDQRLVDARLIEVKGRARGATTVTVTKNEMLTGYNKPDQYLLALVMVGEDDEVDGPYYVRRPFSQAPDWAVDSVNLSVDALLSRAME